MYIYSEVNWHSPKIIFCQPLISEDWGIATLLLIMNIHCASFKCTPPLVHINKIRITFWINSSLWEKKFGYTAHLTAGMIQNTHSSRNRTEWQFSADRQMSECSVANTLSSDAVLSTLWRGKNPHECQMLNIFNILDMPCITPENTFLYIAWNAWFAN